MCSSLFSVPSGSQGSQPEGLGADEVDGHGVRAGARVEGLENGREGKAVSHSFSAPDGSQQPQLTYQFRPSPRVPWAGVSCPSLHGQALQLWTLNFQGGSTWQRWVRWCPLGFERSLKLWTCFVPGRATSGTSRSLGYRAGICKSDVNVALGYCSGATGWRRLSFLVSRMQSHAGSWSVCI